MKKIVLLASFLVYGVTVSFSQTADDIINKCLDALGGKDKLSSIKALYEEGNVDFNGTSIKVQNWMINLTCSRSQSEFAGMKSYTIIRKDSGWHYSQRSGLKKPEPFPRETVRRSQFGLDIQSPLLNYKDKGYTVKYLGKDDDFDGSEAYKIELKASDSLIVTYYIDPDCYLIIGTRTKQITNGRTFVSRTTYSDYEKTSDGFMFPMKENRTKYTLVKVNTDIDKSLFAPKPIR